MTLADVLALASVAGLFIGPAIAVVISMTMDEKRQLRSRQLAAARGLIVGRLNLADPAFQLAINTIPIDFAASDEVLEAWEAYIEAVSKQPAADPHVQAGWSAAQTGLTKAVLVAMGYKERAASQIVRSPYTAQSYVDSIVRQNNALTAVVDVAKNTDRIASANEAIIAAAAAQAAPKPDAK